MPEVHAKLSASGSSRWLACPPSAVLEQDFPNQSSEFAQEGTLAHTLAELYLRKHLGEISTRKYNLEVKKVQANKLYTEDMPDYVEIYTDIIMEKMSEAKSITEDAVFKVEQKLNFSNYVPEGFGTGDMVIISDGVIEIIDLKYGKGVPISAEGNSQMRLYALGALNEFDFLYDIHTVKMTIVQPRLDSISTDTMSVNDLIDWAENVVKPIAALAIKGEGEYKVGNHCRFCRAKGACKSRADYNLELAKYDFKKPAILSVEDIADILDRVDEFRKWTEDVEAYALANAINGEKYPGYKVVEGRSIRKWTDEKVVGDILINNGFQENIIYTKKLTGIGNIEKAIGKKKTQELLGDYIIKPQGKPTLVIESDKRPAFNSVAEDFKD